MDRQRPGGQKARPRCRQSEKENSILSLRICLESICPAEDTLSNSFINLNSNQDLMYRLTIKSSPTGLEGRHRGRGRTVSF
jgi:hypothetical protein